MYKNIHLEEHQVDHYLSDQPVTHYNTSLWRITTAHGKRIPRKRFQRSCVVRKIGGHMKKNKKKLTHDEDGLPACWKSTMDFLPVAFYSLQFLSLYWSHKFSYEFTKKFSIFTFSCVCSIPLQSGGQQLWLTDCGEWQTPCCAGLLVSRPSPRTTRPWLSYPCSKERSTSLLAQFCKTSNSGNRQFLTW